MAACQMCFDPVVAANLLHNNCLLHRAYTNRTEKTVETADRLENKTERKKKTIRADCCLPGHDVV
jgi:hypothetical protein